MWHLIQSFAGLLSFIFFLLHPSYSIAQTPLFSKNQNPFVRVFGLPAAESGQINSEGDFSGQLAIDIANILIVSDEGNEKILLDGETTISTIIMRYGLKEGFEFGLDIPYVVHERGALDYFIEDWHDFFHLPDGHRKDRPRKILEYRYIRGGHTLHLQESSSAGLGDVQLSLATPITGRWLKRGQNMALRVSLKLPTGKTEELHGSGGVDFSLRLCGDDSMSLSHVGLDYWATAGFLFMGKGDVLPDYQRELAAFGTIGLGWHFIKWLDLKVQIDANTALFHSELTELGLGAVLLSMGGTLHLPAEYDLDLNVVEDIAVDTAPDVVFQLVIRKVF